VSSPQSRFPAELPAVQQAARSHREEAPGRARWLPTPRLGYALAAGAALTALAAAWGPVLWLALAWLAVVAVATMAEARSLTGARRVTARRLVEPVLSLGAPNQVGLELRNRSREQFRCLLADTPPLECDCDHLRLACTLPAQGDGAVSYRLTPRRRGDYAFGPLDARLTTTLGLVAQQLRFELSQRVKVYPNLADVRSYELQAQRQRLQQLGVHVTRAIRGAMEFESLRAYVPGDEPRRIDWKATARHGKPITRQYDIERSQHMVVLLDLGRLMVSRLGALTKADHAVNAATLVSHVASRAGDWVGLLAFSARTSLFVPPRRGQFPLLLESLYGLHAERAESDYQGVFLDAAQRIRKRSLIILLTDLLDPESSSRLVRHVGVLARRHVVLCAALSDYELYDLASRPPEMPRDLYERAVAASLLEDRQRALSALRQAGVMAFDATPSNLSIAVLNHYLEVKARGLL